MTNPVEHLIAVRGPEKIISELTRTPFFFAHHVPVPEMLRTVTESELLNFHLVYGDVNLAKMLVDEIGQPWPFAASAPRTSELNSYIKANPRVQTDAFKVMRINSAHGVVSQRQWKQENWGCVRDIQPQCWSPHDEPGCASVCFSAPSVMAAGISRFIEKNPLLEIVAIVVDNNAREQWVLARKQGSSPPHIHTRKELIEPGQSSWMSNPPEEFQRFQ